MKLKFTKMQGLGNDFVVINALDQPFTPARERIRFLADRHFGIGCDQVLLVKPASAPGLDFDYRIYNADGGEVEQCGNGARCFARFVRDQGLSTKDVIRVQTQKGVIEPRLMPDGRVTVDMGAPVFDPARIPFDASGMTLVAQGDWGNWPLVPMESAKDAILLVATLSMGNPHAVLQVPNVDSAPVAKIGPLVQRNARFPQGVNVGFMQVQDRNQVRLRVFERGVGETLACGTGACAAVVAGIRLGLLDSPVRVQTRGGELQIAWTGADAPVYMTGPATTVFRGEIELPETL